MGITLRMALNINCSGGLTAVVRLAPPACNCSLWHFSQGVLEKKNMFLSGPPLFFRRCFSSLFGTFLINEM